MPLLNANVISHATNKNGFIVLRFNNTGGVLNSGILLNSNATFQGANAVGDTLANMHINYINYSLGGSANAQIYRGANLVLQAFPGQEGNFDYGGNAITLEKGGENTANLNVVMTGPGTIVMKLKKNSVSQTES
jgi:hypothetical protein